jgi:hypothetical protein
MGKDKLNDGAAGGRSDADRPDVLEHSRHLLPLN